MLDDGSKEDRRDQRKKKQAGESGVHSCVARISISLVFLMQCMLLDVGAPYQKIQYKLCNCSSVFLQVLGLRKISVIKKRMWGYSFISLNSAVSLLLKVQYHVYSWYFKKLKSKGVHTVHAWFHAVNIITVSINDCQWCMKYTSVHHYYIHVHVSCYFVIFFVNK